MERRELFKILGATAVAAELGLAQHLHETMPAETYTARAFRPEQLAMLNQLCEIILPSDEESPGAGKANVALYLDMFVSFRGSGTKQLFEEGLALVDARSRAQFQKAVAEFAGCQHEGHHAS